MDGAALAQPSSRNPTFGENFGFVSMILACFFGLYCLAAWAVQGSAADNTGVNSAGGTPVVTFYPADYLKAMGLNVNKPIPLRLGGLVSGTSGTATSTVSGDLFGFSSVTSLNLGPDQLLKIGFRRADGTRYIFFFSIKKIRVAYPALKSGEQPYVKFTVKNTAVTTQHYSVVRLSGSSDFWTFQTPKYGVRKPTISQTADWNYVQTAGLARYLERNVTSIALGLTPKQYQSVLNG